MTAKFTPLIDRLYLHGDPLEGAPDTYYCERCDLFVARGHFDGCRLGTLLRGKTCYVETHEWRCVTMRRQVLRTFAHGDRRRFVDDPGNLSGRGRRRSRGCRCL